jgi:hypothetical protein
LTPIVRGANTIPKGSVVFDREGWAWLYSKSYKIRPGNSFASVIYESLSVYKRDLDEFGNNRINETYRIETGTFDAFNIDMNGDLVIFFRDESNQIVVKRFFRSYLGRSNDLGNTEIFNTNLKVSDYSFDLAFGAGNASILSSDYKVGSPDTRYSFNYLLFDDQFVGQRLLFNGNSPPRKISSDANGDFWAFFGQYSIGKSVYKLRRDSISNFKEETLLQYESDVNRFIQGVDLDPDGDVWTVERISSGSVFIPDDYEMSEYALSKKGDSDTLILKTRMKIPGIKLYEYPQFYGF